MKEKETGLKHELLAFVSCFALVSSALADTQKPAIYNPNYGNSRIIFAAQFDKPEAFFEGIRAGGSVFAAHRQCLSTKKMAEEIYGKGACEKVKEYAPNEHAMESRSYHIFWHVAVPCATIGMVMASGAAAWGYKKGILQRFFNTHFKRE